MRNTIPPSIRISHKVSYEVVFVEEFADPRVLGECRYDSKQIVIRTKGQTPLKQWSTFVHEALHAISFETPGASLTERQVLALEKAIMRVQRLNNL